MKKWRWMAAYRMSLVIFWIQMPNFFSSLIYPFSKLFGTLRFWSPENLQNWGCWRNLWGTWKVVWQKTRKSLKTNHPLLKSLRKDLVWHFLEDNFAKKPFSGKICPKKDLAKARRTAPTQDTCWIFPKTAKLHGKGKFPEVAIVAESKIFHQKLTQFLLENDLKPRNCEFSFTKTRYKNNLLSNEGCFLNENGSPWWNPSPRYRQWSNWDVFCGLFSQIFLLISVSSWSCAENRLKRIEKIRKKAPKRAKKWKCRDKFFVQHDKRPRSDSQQSPFFDKLACESCPCCDSADPKLHKPMTCFRHWKPEKNSEKTGLWLGHQITHLPVCCSLLLLLAVLPQVGLHDQLVGPEHLHLALPPTELELRKLRPQTQVGSSGDLQILRRKHPRK